MSSYIEGALICGWAAYAFARILARHWREEVEDLPPHLRAPLEDALEALDHAARRWEATRRGNAEALPAEAAPSSEHELSTREAADVLKVSERRIRQLADAGALVGRKEGPQWRLRKDAVLAYRESE